MYVDSFLTMLVFTWSFSLQLIMRSTNMREVALNFRKYARKIRRKAKPQDPNLANISEMCYKVRYAVTAAHIINLFLIPDRAMVQTEHDGILLNDIYRDKLVNGKFFRVYDSPVGLCN